jgi:RHS repeat-associated protein
VSLVEVTAVGNVSTTYEYYTNSQRLKRIYTRNDVQSVTLQDIRYEFDKVSNVTKLADYLNPSGSASCSLTNIQYDDFHRLMSLTSASQGSQKTYTYNALGNIVTNGELGTGTYTYGSSKPHAVTAVGGNNSYQYDACGNMTTRNRNNQAGQTLAYDEQNRLKQVAIAGGSTVKFGYSSDDSRLWKMVGTQLTNVWIGDIYEEQNGTILCHVYAGGRLVATFEPYSSTACLIQNNRYLAVVFNAGGQIFTGLFGHGRMPTSTMALAILAGVGFGFYYRRERLRRVYDLASPSRPTLFWRQVVLTSLVGSIFVGSMPACVYADSPAQTIFYYYYYYSDHLGSSRLITDRDRNAIQRYGYSGFGRSWDPSVSVSVSHRYTSQIQDEDTGLYYYHARYYDPELGRFIQADPIVPDPWSSQSFDRYSYCVNNPLKYVDPSGNIPGGSLMNLTLMTYAAVTPAEGYIAGYMIGAMAYPGQLSIVNGLIDALDVAQQDLRVLKVYDVRYLEAGEIGRKLEEIEVIGRGSRRAVGVPRTGVAVPAEVAEGSLSETPTVVVLEATNSLIINATEEQHARIEAMMDYLDAQVHAETIPYEIYFLENQGPEDMAKTIERIIHEMVPDRDGKLQRIVRDTDEQIMIVPDKGTFSLIVYASRKNQEWISKLIGTLDKARPQVLIDVTLVEIRKTDEFTYDLNFVTSVPDLTDTGGQTGAFKSGDQTVIAKLQASGRSQYADAQVSSGHATGFYADVHVNTLLKMMQKKNYGRVLAKPKILVNDNTTGTIKTADTTYVIKKTSIPVTSGSAGTQNALIETAVDYQPYNAGITLDITPHISDGELLRLEVNLT